MFPTTATIYQPCSAGDLKHSHIYRWTMAAGWFTRTNLWWATWTSCEYSDRNLLEWFLTSVFLPSRVTTYTLMGKNPHPPYMKYLHSRLNSSINVQIKINVMFGCFRTRDKSPLLWPPHKTSTYLRRKTHSDCQPRVCYLEKMVLFCVDGVPLILK